MLAAGVASAGTDLPSVSHGDTSVSLWGHGYAGLITCVCLSTPAGAVG